MYGMPLNAALAADSLQCQVEGEAVAGAEASDPLIIPPPGQPDLEAVVRILDADAVPHRFPAVADRERILALVAEVDDGCSEHRPIAVEQDAPRQAKLRSVRTPTRETRVPREKA